MYKNINNIKAVIKTSFLDWPGNISTVLFLGGCNFRCPYCHNKELVLSSHKMKDISFDKVKKILTQHPGWIDGVVISGGEPTLYSRLIPLIKIIRNMGLKVKLDTNGSKPNILRKLIKEKLIDYIAIDFKAPLQKDIYARCIGIDIPILSKIKRSIRLLLREEVEYEFRTTVCPVLLEEKDIYKMAKDIRGAKRFILQNFKANNTLNPRFEKIVPYSEKRIEEMKKIILFNINIK